MPATLSQFENALLEVVKTVLAEDCHMDFAIEVYLSNHGLDADDPGLWSDLRHAGYRLLRLIVEEGGCRDAEALKFLARLGVSRAIRSEIPADWSLCDGPSRAASAIRALLHALRQGDPDEGLRWWRLYTMPWIGEARSPASLLLDRMRLRGHG